MEDPLGEEILRGSFKGKDLIKITVKTEDEKTKHLYFEALTHPPAARRRRSSSRRRGLTRRNARSQCEPNRKPTVSAVGFLFFVVQITGD